MWINMTESYYGEVTFKAVIFKSHVLAGKKKKKERPLLTQQPFTPAAEALHPPGECWSQDAVKSLA